MSNQNEAQILPRDLGLPAKFKSWRPGQWASIETAVKTDCRFVLASQPTGAGKSLFGVACAKLNGGRAVYQTASKALQDQAISDFAECGMVDMRGRQNYSCVKGMSSDKDLTCTEGRILGCREGGCPYNADREAFLESSLGLTNYDYSFSSIIHSEGIGDVETLILDEGHETVQKLCSAVEVRLNHREYSYLYQALTSPPEPSANLAQWRTWAQYLLPRAQAYLKKLKEAENTKWLRLADSFVMTLSRIAYVPEDWILDTSNPSETLISPLWPTDYAAKYLFQEVPRIIIMSATLVPKTASLLGIKQEESIFLSQDSSFNPSRCPVYLFGPCNVDYRMSAGQFSEVVGRMDMIISRRLDRKGIIHCTSYEYQSRILRESEHAHLMIAPTKASELKSALREFLTSPAPRILISPAVTTGYDFPMDACEYAILLKVPFIDSRSPVMAARQKEDPEYVPYLVAQTLVQTCGRHMRGNEDRAETFILDAHANRFLKGPARRSGDRGGFRHLTPPWFMRQVKFPWDFNGLPNPPPPLSASASVSPSISA